MTERVLEQIIQIQADDDIAAIRDRLTWAESSRVVLVISRRNKAMRDKMNLKLIQRAAIDQATTVALVAHHFAVAVGRDRDEGVLHFDGLIGQAGRGSEGCTGRACR